MTTFQILKSLPSFQGWKDSDLQKLSTITTLKSFSPGEPLFTQNDPSSSFFIVVTGTVSIRKSVRGDDLQMTNLGPMSIFGELAMLVDEDFEPESRTATAEPVEPCTVIEIPFLEFQSFLTEMPHLSGLFYRKLAVSLAARIRRTTDDLAGLRALRLRNV